jgi:hypothetical protein
MSPSERRSGHASSADLATVESRRLLETSPTPINRELSLWKFLTTSSFFSELLVAILPRRFFAIKGLKTQGFVNFRRYYFSVMFFFLLMIQTNEFYFVYFYLRKIILDFILILLSIRSPVLKALPDLWRLKSWLPLAFQPSQKFKIMRLLNPQKITPLLLLVDPGFTKMGN